MMVVVRVLLFVMMMLSYAIVVVAAFHLSTYFFIFISILSTQPDWINRIELMLFLPRTINIIIALYGYNVSIQPFNLFPVFI